MNQQFGVIELRRYTLKPGTRPAFARYFESYFPEAFQQLGAVVAGHFFERAQPDRFAWLRGYADMDARLVVNQAFYHGPVWAEHKARLNALMVDSDDVLLLCPAFPDSGLGPTRAVDPVAEPDGAAGIAVAQVFDVDEDRRDAFARLAAACFAGYRAGGVDALAILKTLHVPNNFPQHPIRTDGSHVAWLGLVRDEQALDGLRPLLEAGAARLAGSGLLRGATELLILDPAARSRLRWTGDTEAAADAP